MLFRRNRFPRIEVLRPADEGLLESLLRERLEENVYLLGLLADYTLRGLQEMRWGRFFVCQRPESADGVFYVDATGLVVLSGASDEAIALFNHYTYRENIAITRIISSRHQAETLQLEIQKLRGKAKPTKTLFPEVGMRLSPSQLTGPGEAGLELAKIEDAREIAEESAKAMLEELEIPTPQADFDRLIRSKVDLIEKQRYFLFRQEGRIAFQAYLSASLPEVGQIQGVWVPPAQRGRGLATRCLAEMCARCFANHHVLTLRVQERNLPARSVYLKVGFIPFLDYLSVWYEKGE